MTRIFIVVSWRCPVVVLQEMMAYHFINTWCVHSHSSDASFDLNICPYSLASIRFFAMFQGSLI